MTYDLMVTGTDGDDVLTDLGAPSPGHVLIQGLGGSDTITTTAAFVRIECEGGDIVTGSDGYEVVVQTTGDDFIDIKANGKIICGAVGGVFTASTAPGDINETVSYAENDASLEIWFNGDGTADVSRNGSVMDRLTGFDRYLLGDGNDHVVGRTGTAFLDLRTRGGDDDISFCYADQTVFRTGSGNDTIDLKFSDYQTADIRMGSGADRIFCGNGADTIRFRAGPAKPEEATFLVISDFDKSADKIAVSSEGMVKCLLSHAYETEWQGVTGLWIDAPHGADILINEFKLADLSETMFLVV